jgi:hypothetical protein
VEQGAALYRRYLETGGMQHDVPDGFEDEDPDGGH